jgi:CSLREA domain-containing protein
MLSNPASKLVWRQRTTVLMVGLAVIMGALLLMVGLLAPRAQAAPSTFIVNTTGDENDLDFPGGLFDGTSDGVCDVDAATAEDQCTLRAAIQEANENDNPTEQDLINFNIPDSVDPGVKTISPGSTLPDIIEPVIIDGYSQPLTSANTLAKRTNAKLLIELNGNNSTFRALDIQTSNSVVKGLVINRFSGHAIVIFPDADNLLTNVRIEGNFIGTNPAGTSALANSGAAVYLFACCGQTLNNSTVGGTSRASRNLISGNHAAGVFIQNGGSASVDDNTVQGNLIGTKKDGIQPLGNLSEGVSIRGDAKGNRILSNSIFSNGGIGIDLGDDGPTANDSGDTDTGSNRLQNFPVLEPISQTTPINGTLNSLPNKRYTIQFFSSPSGDEGQTFIGQKVVTTDASGNASFSFTPTTAVAIGRQITATATRNATGDTSEFSAARQVPAS